MTSQTTISKGILFAGFAAAFMLMTSSVRAQEITNTEFNDGPNVAAMAQPVDAQPNAAAAATPASEAMPANESAAASGELQEASAVQVPRHLSETWVLASFGVSASLIALYILGETKRSHRASRVPYASTPSA